MADVLPFPPFRRVAYVRRQAEFILTMNSEAGERHLARQISLQRGTLLSKGVEADRVERECAALEAAIRSALWRAVFSPEGAA